jgi:Leucine-rich repeat (LRR) protein
LPKLFTQLRALELSQNRLTALPESLRNLKSLKELYLHGNDALNLPTELLGPTWGDVISEKAKPAKPHGILDYYCRNIRFANLSKPLAQMEPALPSCAKSSRPKPTGWCICALPFRQVGLASKTGSQG